MNHAEKRRFIKDPVWGEVEFFSWERELLDHPLINRLHGIVQTSCTYKVYPSLRYSRFAHSVGALYTVTRLFVNVARNLRVNAHVTSDAEDKKRYRQGTKQLTGETKLIQDRLKKVVKGANQLNAVKDVLCRAFPIERDDALALAVVRIGALLHDLGHLPYSHLLENTVERFVEFDRAELNALPKTTRNYHDELKRRSGDFETHHQKLGKFHEQLGYQFATMLANDENLSRNEHIRHFLRHAIEQARDVWSCEIFGEKPDDPNTRPTNLTPILSSLLSGDIDADRMDFVHRDSYFSGLFKCSVDFDRLFDLYEAGKNPATDDNGLPTGWVVRPSCRSASDAAKLLIERFQLYKYVIAHHRVHLFDEMLERCLIELIRAGRLNDLLDAIIGVLNLPEGRPDSTIDLEEQHKLRSYLLHLDDAWLDTQVRTWNVSKKAKKPDLTKNKRCKMLFEGFLEKRGHFKSVFKWDRDFNAWWQPQFVHGPFETCFNEWMAKKKREETTAFQAVDENSLAWKTFVATLRDNILNACRGDIVRDLFARRYEFAKKLESAANVQAVIVGVTGKKVRGHMKSVEDARFFGLTSANGYLTAATLETMVFNIWFVPENDEAKEQQDVMLKECLKWLEQEVLRKQEPGSTTTIFESTANLVWKNMKELI